MPYFNAGQTLSLFYPNPAHDQLTYAGTQDGNLQLINQLGQVVYSSAVNQDVTLQLPRLPASLYQTRLVLVGSEVKRGKVVIE